MNKYVLLGFILIFFFATRLFKITEVPGSVYWDEASIGYNAYAVATDLKDEWGEFLPLHFRAFGEFKLPVYVYSVMFTTILFGLGDLAVRLPAVIYSLGVVLVLYLLVSKITKEVSVGLIAAFIMSVSPWFFIFSRTGYEASAGLFFFLLFLYLLLKYQENKVYIILAGISGILSFYSYNAFRIIVPVFIVFWALTQKHQSIKLELIAVSIFLISLIPVVRLYQLDQGAARFNVTNARSLKQVISNYFSHFDYKFLFVKGDANYRSQQPGWGELYLIDLPFLLIGLWEILKSKNKLQWLFFVLILVGPIPAAITRESPHALRAIILAPALAAVSALGMWQLSRFFPERHSKIIAVSLISYLLFFESYYSDFIKNYNAKTASAWQYEYKEIFRNTSSGTVTDQYAQPYIFALYYLKYPPEEFRRTVSYNPPDKWGFSTVSGFNGFQFKKL